MNNRFLKHWFIRDSHETGNSTRKIFETYSRLNLQDAINIVNQQNTSQFNNNNPPEKTLSSMMRTLTESNLSSSESPASLPPSFTSICIDTTPTGAFNFDLANLDYSPSRRDVVEAEIHHILAANLFKPVRRVSLLVGTACAASHLLSSTASTARVTCLRVRTPCRCSTWRDTRSAT